jgi:hypothetical protein
MSQAPTKLQTLNPETDAALETSSFRDCSLGLAWDLDFDFWNFSGAWMLVLDV